MSFLKKYWLVALTAVCAGLIGWSGAVYGQPFYRMLPLFVSLGIGLLQSRASRYALLVGSANCLVYTLVYWGLGLYANAAYAFFFSLPLQLATFLRWKKRAYKNSTRFRSLRLKQWLLGGAGFAALFIAANVVLSLVDSGYAFWDSATSLLGILVSVLQLLSFREYSWIMFLSAGSNIALNCSMLPRNPGQITFVIYAIHAFICVTVQFFSVRRLFAEQQKENAYENHPS